MRHLRVIRRYPRGDLAQLRYRDWFSSLRYVQNEMASSNFSGRFGPIESFVHVAFPSDLLLLGADYFQLAPEAVHETARGVLNERDNVTTGRTRSFKLSVVLRPRLV